MGQEMNLTKEQLNESYKDYRDVFGGDIAGMYSRRIELITYEVPIGSKVLDIGANSGEVMKILAEKRQCDVVGVDMSEIAVAKAKEKGLNVILGDAESLPFPDKTFDVVLLLETLNHLWDPLKALLEVKRVLKDDGILLGSVPHKNLSRYIWEEDKPHHGYYDVKELGEILDKVFTFSHLRPLKAAQLTINFAPTFMASELAEILFKCANGGDHHTWESLMRSKDVLRVWFGPTQYEGTVYYRMRGFADKMRERGVESAYEHFDYKNTDAQSQWQNRCRNKIVLDQLDAILKVADLSVWQLVANPDALAMLRCVKDVIKKPIITECDDYLFDVPQYNIASGPYKPNSPYEWYTLKQFELSDAIICSTSFIMDKLREIEQLREKPYYVIPNSIDFAIWDNLKDVPSRKPEGLIRIGYTGCGNHGGDLSMIKEPLLAILNEFHNVEFIWSVPMKDPHDPSKDFVLDHPRARMINSWYTMMEYPQAIKNWGMDIGVAPLIDNNFNRAKSNLRWLEYSALSVPCVASNVQPFKTSIKDGEDGLLCRGSQAWYNALKRLIQSAEERKKLGESAYQRIKRDFNMDAVTDRYIRVLEEIKRDATIRSGSRDSAAVKRPELDPVVPGNDRQPD